MGGSVYVVAGSRGNFGREIAAGLLAKGRKVLAVDKFPNDGEMTSAAVCDFSLPDATRVYFESIAAEFDDSQAVLVLALGTIHSEPLLRHSAEGFVTHSESHWDDTLGSNLKTVFVATTEFARMCRLERKEGLVIAFSSISASGNPGQAAYSAAKAGVEGFVAAAAKELGPLGIRVVAISPGFYETESTRANLSDAHIEKIRLLTPLRRLGQADELVGIVSWLAESSFVTGEIIRVNGGLTL